MPNKRDLVDGAVAAVLVFVMSLLGVLRGLAGITLDATLAMLVWVFLAYYLARMLGPKIIKKV